MKRLRTTAQQSISAIYVNGINREHTEKNPGVVNEMSNLSNNPVAILINRKSTLYVPDLPALLGSADTADVCFFHDSVSNEHCLFEYINHRITVRDLGSNSGTAINGVRLEPNIPYSIENGANIRIGKVRFVFHSDQEELIRREKSQPNNSAAGPRTPKIVTVSAREVIEYEYSDDEVVYIECGLMPEKADKNTSLKQDYTGEKTVLIEDEVREASNRINDKAISLFWFDSEESEQKTITVDQFPFYIGRKSSENNYALRKKGVSRKHFHIEEADGEYFLIDDNSTNGVKLNGNRISADERVRIKTGDKLTVADVTLTVRTER